MLARFAKLKMIVKAGKVVFAASQFQRRLRRHTGRAVAQQQTIGCAGLPGDRHHAGFVTHMRLPSGKEISGRCVIISYDTGRNMMS
jgi:hypothetical protein